MLTGRPRDRMMQVLVFALRRESMSDWTYCESCVKRRAIL